MAQIKADLDPALVGLSVNGKIIANLRPETVAFSQTISDLAGDYGYPDSTEKVIYAIPENGVAGSNRVEIPTDYINVFRYVGEALKNGRTAQGAAPAKEGEVVPSQKKLEPWEVKFFTEVANDQDRLFGLVLAANRLAVKQALEAGALAIAEQIKGKTPEQIRSTFLIPAEGQPAKSVELPVAAQ